VGSQHRDRMVPKGWENSPGVEAILLGLEGDPTAINYLGDSSGKEKVSTLTQNISLGLAQQLMVAFNPVVDFSSVSDGDLMAVTRITTDTSLTASGLYVVDSSVAVRTITLPLLSAVGSDGMVFKIKREGANFVDIVCAGADEFEPGSITTRRLFTNWSALSIAADSAANYWYDYGYYGAIT